MSGKLVGAVVAVVGAIFFLGGVTTWFMVQNELADEHITVADDASWLAGDDVNGPFSAFMEAQTIKKHALEATNDRTYAQLERDDPMRQTAMTASFLRGSLFTSVVAFGVSAFAAVLGVVMVWLGLFIRRLEPEH